MTALFTAFSVILVLAAIASWCNHRWLRLPTTIGVMAITLALSLLVLGLDLLGLPVRTGLRGLLETAQFEHAVLDVLLSFLLFAGALHVRLDDLLAQKRLIAVLATLGVVFSTFAVGSLLWLVQGALGLELPFAICLVFGALISPTDPIAVLGIFKSADAPPSLKAKVTGESLFNDGIGVVVFLVMMAIASSAGGHGGEGHGSVDTGSILHLLAVEVLLGMVLGGAGGWIAYRLLRSVEDHHLEVLITLALACGIYVLAASLHSSGPLAVVVAGLLIGNTGRTLAMSESIAAHVDAFWEVLDEILNVILFALIGLELLALDLDGRYLIAGLVAIPLVLLARFTAVGLTVRTLRLWRDFTPHAVKIVTWAGLRGGISVALALSIPAEAPGRDAILTITYVVVVFSILVQGLSIGRLLRWAQARG